MGADEAFPVLQVLADFRRTHHRTVGAEDAVGSAALLQFGEGFLLQRHVLENRFDYQIRILYCVAVQIFGEVNPGKTLVQLCFRDDFRLHQLLHGLANSAFHIHRSDIINRNIMLLNR